VDACKKDLDPTLIRGNRKFLVEERFRQAMELARFAAGLRRAGREARRTVACRLATPRCEVPGTGIGIPLRELGAD